MKIFKRSIALGLILILSLTLLVACKAKSDDDANTPDNSGSLSGKYTAVLDNATKASMGIVGELYMEFMADGKFNLAMDNVVKEGTYTVSGNSVEMTIDDVPQTATINGNKIIFEEGTGEELVFEK